MCMTQAHGTMCSLRFFLQIELIIVSIRYVLWIQPIKFKQYWCLLVQFFVWGQRFWLSKMTILRSKNNEFLSIVGTPCRFDLFDMHVMYIMFSTMNIQSILGFICPFEVWSYVLWWPQMAKLFLYHGLLANCNTSISRFDFFCIYMLFLIPDVIVKIPWIDVSILFLIWRPTFLPHKSWFVMSNGKQHITYHSVSFDETQNLILTQFPKCNPNSIIY